jgi:hypothetical protein
MTAENKLTFDDLVALARSSATVTCNCGCGIQALREWTRIPMDFPQAQMRRIGTLLEDPYLEPTHAEYHPDRTGYWSADAPIAPRYYPYNRCTVQRCTVCGRSCLSYVEAGGYYVEPRIRALDPALLVDAAPED